ncbi:MAG TPA: sterol desaturase family protein [Polyangiaceae bacterium]|jgi:sterol desaturase/sphingolipid hydroxylase (fatty acid hydroxylase superfamily)
MSIWDFPTKPPPNAGTSRMFQSDLFERFSRIHPATPFIAWLPVIGIVLARGVLRHDLSLLAIAGIFVAGVLAWTLSEYVLHRWVFHWMEDSERGRRIHFLLHGVHHDFPSDKDRLVMPLGFSIPVGSLFYLFFTWVMGVTLGGPFFAGFVLGYLVYDGSHYAIHHFRMHSSFLRLLKKHHMLHHHADHDGGFGVSSPLWDVIFRTMPEPKKRMGASTAIHFTSPTA